MSQKQLSRRSLSILSGLAMRLDKDTRAKIKEEWETNMQFFPIIFTVPFVLIFRPLMILGLLSTFILKRAYPEFDLSNIDYFLVMAVWTIGIPYYVAYIAIGSCYAYRQAKYNEVSLFAEATRQFIHRYTYAVESMSVAVASLLLFNDHPITSISFSIIVLVGQILICSLIKNANRIIDALDEQNEQKMSGQAAWQELMNFWLDVKIDLLQEIYGIGPEEGDLIRKKNLKKLGLSEDASPEQIKAAYLALAKRIHPDSRPPEEKAVAHEEFLELQKAYGELQPQN